MELPGGMAGACAHLVKKWEILARLVYISRFRDRCLHEWDNCGKMTKFEIFV